MISCGKLRKLPTVSERSPSISIHCKPQSNVRTVFAPIKKSLVSHLDDLGLVDDNLVLGHAVYLSESDITLLGERKASITHHPSCNLAMRNGIAPILPMLKAESMWRWGSMKKVSTMTRTSLWRCG